MADVTEAIARENAPSTPGRVGEEPTAPGTRVSTPLTIRGQLTTPEAFAAIPLRANADGSRLVLVAAGCYHIQNVNSLHARYGRFIEPFCGPATKNLNGYIRWLEVQMAGLRPADVIRAS